MCQPLEHGIWVVDRNAGGIAFLRAEMHDQTHAVLRSQVHRGKEFRGAKTRHVPFDALRNALVCLEDDASQGEYDGLQRVTQFCEEPCDALGFEGMICSF